MFCSKCGAQIPDNTKFCPTCGAPCSTGQKVADAANNMFNATEQEIGSALHDVHQSFNGNNNQVPPSGAQRLKDDRGLLSYIVLSIITCGIYAYYWYYKLGNRLSANAPRYGLNFQENGTTVLLWCLVGILLCGLGPFIAMNILIKNSNQICNAYNRANGLY